MKVLKLKLENIYLVIVIFIKYKDDLVLKYPSTLNIYFCIKRENISKRILNFKFLTKQSNECFSFKIILLIIRKRN